MWKQVHYQVHIQVNSQISSGDVYFLVHYMRSQVRLATTALTQNEMMIKLKQSIKIHNENII